MSSKRLSMDDIKRMTRSQTKAKGQNKQLPNLTTTEPSVSGYSPSNNIFRKNTLRPFLLIFGLYHLLQNN